MPARTTSTTPARTVTRAPALLTLVVAMVAALALFGTGAGAAAAPWGDADRDLLERTGATPADGELAAEEVSADAPAEDAQDRTDVFATVGAVELHALSHDVQVNGFHQASSPASRTMTPVGSDTAVLPSRGRGYSATSAVDVVLVDDEPVRSPITGTVVELDRYQLYGRTADLRLAIQSADHPHIEVVLLHVERPEVEVGDEVVAGETVVAGGGRQLPFRSQVDRETAPDAWPHVHIEVKDRS